MKINEFNAPVQPDTYEASMLIKQAIRAGKYSIQIHNLLSNEQEVEAWVQKKIDLATNYVKKVAKYLELEGQYGEDAGEGHMAKSQLYHSAKYAMQIAQMVKPGDDIEAWVQTKMNKAVDMLDAVYHYEDYQRMNPYRETLGDVCDQHSAVIQTKIDEILAYETEIDDIETKPGMFNIMKKRVSEFEKKMSKEMEEGSRMPSSMIKTKQKLDAMSPEEINHFFQKRAHFFNKPAKELARQQELRFGKKVASMAPYSRHIKSKDELDEGIRDWAKKLAAAGVIVGAVAGLGSINNAIDNSVPAIKAMNTAYEMAMDADNKQLADMIKKDIRDAKLRLDTGKDLNHVKYLQDKYSKFMIKEYSQSPFKQQIINKLKKPADDYLAQKQKGEYIKKLQQKLQDKLIDKKSV